MLTSKPVPEKFKEYLHRAKTAGPFLETGKDIVAGWGGVPDLLKHPAGQGRAKSPAGSKD